MKQKWERERKREREREREREEEKRDSERERQNEVGETATGMQEYKETEAVLTWTEEVEKELKGKSQRRRMVQKIKEGGRGGGHKQMDAVIYHDKIDYTNVTQIFILL